MGPHTCALKADRDRKMNRILGIGAGQKKSVRHKIPSGSAKVLLRGTECHSVVLCPSITENRQGPLVGG